MEYENDIVKKFKDSQIKCEILCQSEPPYSLFRAVDIGKLCGHSNIRASIQTFTEKECLLKPSNSQGGKQLTIFFTIQGLKRFISKSRKASAIQIANLIGLEVNLMIPPIEASTMLNIQRAFSRGMTCTLVIWH